jgi:putative transposase
MIVIEDLKVSNMSKSAKGTAERHGRNVRAKSGLNRSILDQGWYEMRRQLEYKQLWRGGQVLAIPPPIPVSGVPAVVIRRKKTVKRKVNSCVRYAATPRTPISTEHVTF